MPKKVKIKTQADRFSRKIRGNSPTKRYRYAQSYDSKPEWPDSLQPLPCRITKRGLNDDCDWFDPAWPKWDPREDANSVILDQDIKWDERLYAGVYDKVLSTARQGNAELGLNVLEARKTLTTFLDLSLLGLLSVETLRKTSIIGLKALQKEPTLTPRTVRVRLGRREAALRRINGREAADRRKANAVKARLRNEIFILKAIAGTLLAYRYGVLPVCSDLAATAKLMSEDYKDAVRIRKSGTRPVGLRSGANTWRQMTYTGTQRCTVQLIASASNPNLLLANRLGLINPQLWLWELTPWSFVVDWWLPVGTFLNNFTASVGLDFTGLSITRTYKGDGTISCDYTSQQSLKFTGTWYAAHKERTTSVMLPVPVSIPYGKGLSIQRGQNALALIVQKLKPRV